jgi:hypothetical protein
MRKLKVCFLSADTGGSGYYRTKLPAKYLQQSRYDDLEVMHYDDFRLIKDPFDVLIIQRQWRDHILVWCLQLKKQGTRIIFELDDNLWSIPSTIDSHKIYQLDTLHKIENFIRMSNAVITTSDPLRVILSQFNSNVCVIPNFVEIPEIIPQLPKRRIKIGFCGSVSHVEHLKILTPILIRLNAICPKIELIVMGLPCPELSLYATTILPASPESFINALASLELDIGLAYVFDNIFDKCRSWLKFLEYSITGAVTVAPNLEPYSNIITNGENGILINKDSDWLSTLTELVKSGDYKSMARVAYQETLNSWLIQNNVYRWYNVIQETVDGQREQCA